MTAAKNQQDTSSDQPKAEVPKTAPELPGKATATTKQVTSPEEAVIAAPDKGSETAGDDAIQEVDQEAQDESSNETPEPASERSPGDQTANVDDAETGKAVDDIAAEEADTMLALQDAVNDEESDQDNQTGWKARLRRLLRSRRTWTIVFVLLLLLFAVPVTRYRLLGLVIKKQVTVTVFDSQTQTPVSAASVEVHGVTAKTSADGVAKLKVAPGQTHLVVNKRYYKTYDQWFFIGLTGNKKAKVRFQATGRQVPVKVLNTFTGEPLANAEIKVLKTSAKTDKRGKATIVLPASEAVAAGTISAKGYNSAKATIQVTDKVINTNRFNLTPSGRVYFLSNVGGLMNVIKTNLDGSDRKIVLEGTGREDSTAMTLLATRDWRYLVLKSRRDTAQAALYLIDTKDDKVTQFDSSNGTFNPIGWSGHNFLYDFVSAAVPLTQKGHEVVKSYDAERRQLNQLDQSQSDAEAYQDFFNFYVLDDQLVYNTQWYSDGGSLDNKNASIRGLKPDGRDKKDYQTFPAPGLSYILAALYQPQAIYFAAHNNAANMTTFYNFANQTVNTVSLDQGYFRKAHPTYLLSPSGERTFWTAQQDGRDELFIGDRNAQKPKQLNGLSGYKPYGWYTDDYVLLSKGGSELYIAPASGLKQGQRPFKISYYYKPIHAFPGYGYGYGGQ